MEKNNYEKLDFSNKFSKKYKEFTPILNEYFSRMKAELQLSDEEILAKVNLLMRNVKSIKFGLMSTMYEGVFSPERRKVILNANMLNSKQNYEHVFSILTHELDHACSYDEKSKTFGMYRYDETSKFKFNSQDVLLDELRTDIAATRRVFNNNYTDDSKMIRKTEGYHSFSTFSTVLQNCLGISEKEFLVASNNGRAVFDKQMETKFANSEDYHKFMERFTLNTSMLLNIRSGKTLVSDINIADFGKAFLDLKDLSYIGLNLRMEKDIIDNPDMNIDEYLKNIRYSAKENSVNFNYTEHEFGVSDIVSQIRLLLNMKDLSDVKKLLQYTSAGMKEKKQTITKAEDMFESKVLYLEMLESNKEMLGEKCKEAVKKITTVKDINELKEYSKEELKLEFKDSKEVEYNKELDKDVVEKRKLDKHNTFKWDNTEIVEEMDELFNISKGKRINKLFALIMKKVADNELPKLSSSKVEELKENNFRQEINELKQAVRKSTKSHDEISKIDKERIDKGASNSKDNDEWEIKKV